VNLRIVHVLQDVRGGGPANATELARHAAAHGADVVIYAPGDLTDLPPGVRGLRLSPKAIHRSETLFRATRRADLLHVHGTRAGTWSLPLLPMTASVVTLHGLHPLRRPAGHVYRFMAYSLVAALSATADALICVSNSDSRLLHRMPLASSTVRVVRNGVPSLLPNEHLRTQTRQDLGIHDGTLVILFVGRMSEAKDPLRAIQIAQELVNQDIALIMAGDGELEGDVRRAAPPNVHLVGHYADTAPLMAAADVVLSTSRWEGLPLALLEAMMAHRPVVASKVEGNTEALGDVGCLIARDDIAGFVKALSCLHDDSVRVAHAAAGQRRATELFTLDRMLAETDDVYAEILGRRPW
jgi:glycosyltransferase involved in cell wall biosynthesis